MRYREVKYLVGGYMASKWLSKVNNRKDCDLNPGLSALFRYELTRIKARKLGITCWCTVQAHVPEIREKGWKVSTWAPEKQITQCARHQKPASRLIQDLTDLTVKEQWLTTRLNSLLLRSWKGQYLISKSHEHSQGQAERRHF